VCVVDVYVILCNLFKKNGFLFYLGLLYMDVTVSCSCELFQSSAW